MIIKIIGGRVIDPGQNIDEISDVYIKNDKIIHVGLSKPAGIEREKDFKIIDASNKIVSPGLIDMHVHLREPGHEYKETIETGCRAAVHGGFTAICCMPNTNPVNDNKEVTEYILKKAGDLNLSRVYPVASISCGLLGKKLSEFSHLKEAGAIAFSDDGHPVESSLFMRRALEYAGGMGLFIISHCEDLELADHGVMNEGDVSTLLGLSGIANESESIMVMRDIALSKLTKTHVHIAHVSTKESVIAIGHAKAAGISVTAETAPHYFTLTDKAVLGYNTNAKMNPPLRSDEDREAVIGGLFDNTIDVIATDHAPHAVIEKELEFDLAQNGIIGLETSLSLGLKLVHENRLTLFALIEKMSTNPAKILGLETGVRPGIIADITIIDPDLNYTVCLKDFYSLSKNTPFDGWQLKGRAVLTMVGGKIVYSEL